MLVEKSRADWWRGFLGLSPSFGQYYENQDIVDDSRRALQVLGCVDFAGWVRQYTYPPGFHYISAEQLRSTMWRMAYH